MSTETPRTDAATYDIDIESEYPWRRVKVGSGGGDHVSADFARGLEREIAYLKHVNAELRIEISELQRH